ncbi:ParA family protein [Sphingomonas carotinifaciens]|uniref:AAA family ATPase n=1 Tax=Sphingomonas carotinifaciens TaxID=1166323 RepID=A0A1G7JBM4_9SPHN|nr:ParA family protein [Sphingomonas carotinifaciens]MBB4084557.1 cellulose biosynthesis protein BcsQ [Sphingomonas carotinifaciens]MWC43948.1 AAA family ATPase [Sphingomonas carotinifaciens]SDF22164.1 Cellulose biosynthesis protein BcsQ [Sphingomonas carotinifaciens]
MKTIAIYSLKGGVGKTSMAANLAWCAASQGRRTLLWDLDPQAAATWLLGGPAKGDRAQAIFSRDIAPAKLIRTTDTPQLDLIGADASLRLLDQLFHDLSKKNRLGKLLDGLGDYDRIILDCPPGLTETTEQVLRAADLVVVPVVPSALAQRALEVVDGHVRGRVPLLPVHVMVDRRRRLHADAVAAQPEWPAIPMASVVEAMGEHRAAVGRFAPRSAAAQGYAALWREVERRIAKG